MSNHSKLAEQTLVSYRRHDPNQGCGLGLRETRTLNRIETRGDIAYIQISKSTFLTTTEVDKLAEELFQIKAVS